VGRIFPRKEGSMIRVEYFVDGEWTLLQPLDFDGVPTRIIWWEPEEETSEEEG
jgi:hypothetical protein